MADLVTKIQKILRSKCSYDRHCALLGVIFHGGSKNYTDIDLRDLEHDAFSTKSPYLASCQPDNLQICTLDREITVLQVPETNFGAIFGTAEKNHP